MRYSRMEHDGAGGSRFADVEIGQDKAIYADGVPPVLVSAPIPAQSVVFVEVTPEADVTEFHAAPRRHIGVVLSGTIEFETTDGAVGRVSAGDLVGIEDVEGIGHRTRVVEGPVRLMLVALADADEERRGS